MTNDRHMNALKNKITDETTSFDDRLRILCGYIENGTDTAVKVLQDDATKDWIVRVGINDTNSYRGSSMMEAFEKAFQDPRNNPFN